MRGAPETAANLFRLLLSLDQRDPCGVLLRLDADLLAAEQYDAVLELHGANVQVAALPAALASAAPRSACSATAPRRSRAPRPGGTSAKTLAVVDTAWATSALAKYAAVPVEEFADGFPQLGPEAAEGFDEANLSPDAAREAARQAQGPVRLARGQRGAVALEDLLDRLPPELRADFAAQLDAGVAPGRPGRAWR
ncbi:hypothetical protein JL721_5654 [Aureococcus anophagefferens]|nr:hypothetical protein JL721_5654 [Aureococcus anophagefferens]